MSTFPIELLTEIFLRLPAKTLLRVKIVCKLWYHLITDLHFVNLHLQRSLTTKTNLHFVVKASKLLYLADFDTFENILELEHPFKNPNHDGFVVIGTVNGLLCLLERKNKQLMIYNPTTQTNRLLPLLHVEEHLAHEEFNFGFGFDTVSQDYKCVWICHTKDVNPNPYSRVMVYSFNNHSWRRGPDIPRFIHNHYFIPALLHETIHWVASNYSVPRPILAFSLQDEKFSSLTLPEFNVERYICKHVTVLDGHLCLLVNYSDDCDVWIMEEYGVAGSWKKVFNVVEHTLMTFCSSAIFMDWFPRECLPKIVSYSSSGKGLFLIRIPPVRVAYLDFETMETKNVEVADFVCFEDAHLCVENLLMLDRTNSVNVEEKEQARNSS